MRDYGNRMGIPTVNGAVVLRRRLPRQSAGLLRLRRASFRRDKCFGEAKPGDASSSSAARTGRDGIHGATFSSAELTDTHADEFSHAVQIGNAITEKKVIDVILQARRPPAACSSPPSPTAAPAASPAPSARWARRSARTSTLDKVPLKYAGLSYAEIWISEAQERMVLAVPAGTRRRAAQPVRSGKRRASATSASSAGTKKIARMTRCSR